MFEKDIKRIVKKQIKNNHPNWKKLSKKRKKQIAKEVTNAIIADYQGHDKYLGVPIEELVGIEEQVIDSRILSLQQMSELVDNFYLKKGIIDFEKYCKPQHREIINEELRFINKLLDNHIIDHLLANDGYSPQMRNIFPSQMFRAELLKAIKYPEVSYRKFCSDEYLGNERKENRRFLGLPLNRKNIIDHTQLSRFRSELQYYQIVNILVYILHHFYRSGLLENCVLHGIDSTEIVNDDKYPLYSIQVGDKKIRIYNDIDCDCGTRRDKRDKSKYFIGYRMHTLTAVNPTTGHAFPLVSLYGPANHHDSLYLKPLVELAQAMGIHLKLITADQAYHDKDGSILNGRGVHLITPVSSEAKLPINVEKETLAVTCHDFCEIPMRRVGLIDDCHEYKCNALPTECSHSCNCPRFRLIPFDRGYFQRMPVDNELAEQAIAIRKNCERPFNLMKKREGLENARVRSQHALTARATFTMIATLLIEMAGTRKKKAKPSNRQLELFKKAA